VSDSNYSDIEFLHLRRRIQELEGLLDAVIGVTHFSRREKQVWALIADGRSSKEIAEHLGIAVKTVVSYRSALMKKLRVHDVVRLSHSAYRLNGSQDRLIPLGS
jgi:DNA-binding CsgD family transcriptional regulator